MMKLKLELPTGQKAIEHPPFHQTYLNDGSPWLQFYRIDGQILLRFPDYADFYVTEDAGTVRCTPSETATSDTVEHLFHNQVAPMVLNKRGMAVFHGSAVDIDGYAITFVGQSGSGKSTLAASFARIGYRFLADDGITLFSERDEYYVAPGHDTIRLWRDSEEHLFPGKKMQFDSNVSYTDKLRIAAGDLLAHCDQPRRLGCIYYLGETNPDGTVFTPMAASEVVIQLLHHSFVLDVQNKEDMARQFTHVTKLANMPIHYRLDYPRDFGHLADLHSAILDHSQQFLHPAR